MDSGSPLTWFCGQYLPKDRVRIAPDDRGFQFGDGVYEFIRSYDGRLFRPKQHVERLEHSLREVRIGYEGTGDLPAIALELLRRNGLTQRDATVYIQVTRGQSPRAHPFPAGDTEPTVYVEARRLAVPAAEMNEGVAVITVPDTRWSRCDIKSICLLPNVLARQQAEEAGASEALFVRDGIVTEGTHTSVFGIRDGKLRTHSLDGCILPGITRSVILELCASLGVEVEEHAIRAEELPMMDELFIASTASEVIPVCTVDGVPIAAGQPGPTTRRFQSAFRELVTRELADRA